MSVEQIGFYALPSDPETRRKMMGAIENCRAASVRIKSEQTFITETLAELAKETGIKAADLRKVVSDRANGTFSKTIETSEKYQDLYSSLFPNDVPSKT
ncbi:transcriptional regulator [Dickeya phage vB-DsoM-LIMEstone1]|uniref:Uncharacterized protein n=12 Tax=Aglimvirinae TaxID=2169530 RepID=I0J2R1_9CAUD|nr:transcriptional regulator [Dickeya phage vB-DsoM-LIMEstone1]YP_009102844.1 transcriptional regulator [Dickeya phage RC-2014]AIM51567.1 hypothetical protein HQ82_0087 [Dickeya phage phiDP10.3]ATW62040.1 putative transcription regulator [Dickeya phage PP35]AYN55612.1 hypothetical protein [Dickeya phage Kamild]QHB41541.1 hypothetical protein [Dickeya phage Ds5CZ]QHB41742.1 hypothetical protein [Dickeya phage Ds9CZ]QHB41945.1 hypothetical protein [Dickeya phage Ds16CZ]QHB42148.1 hypothetical